MAETITIPGIQEKNSADELRKANEKIDELYHFIEMTDALTYDQATSKRIKTFLTEEGVWKN